MLSPELNMKREVVAVLRAMEPRVECIWVSRSFANLGDKIVVHLEAGKSNKEVEEIVRASGDGVAEWTSGMLNKGVSSSWIAVRSIARLANLSRWSKMTKVMNALADIRKYRTYPILFIFKTQNFFHSVPKTRDYKNMSKLHRENKIQETFHK